MEEPNIDDKKELNVNEMEQISGGWVYDGPVEWLKGTNIKCLYCGAEDEETVHYLGRSTMHICFECRNCHNTVNYEYFNGRVRVAK